jgi:hypothetical protein
MRWGQLGPLPLWEPRSGSLREEWAENSGLSSDQNAGTATGGSSARVDEIVNEQVSDGTGEKKEQPKQQ